MKDGKNSHNRGVAADGFPHVECYCRRCRVIRLRPISWLPRISWASPSRIFSTAPLCGVRWSVVFRQTVADLDAVMGKPLG